MSSKGLPPRKVCPLRKAYFPALVFNVCDDVTGAPVAMIAFNNSGYISTLVDKEYRGTGYSYTIWPEILDILKQMHKDKQLPFGKIWGRAHKDNAVPNKIVERLGFTKVETEGDFIMWELPLE